jgi:hypothetical protein
VEVVVLCALNSDCAACTPRLVSRAGRHPLHELFIGELAEILGMLIALPGVVHFAEPPTRGRTPSTRSNLDLSILGPQVLDEANENRLREETHLGYAA